MKRSSAQIQALQAEAVVAGLGGTTIVVAKHWLFGSTTFELNEDQLHRLKYNSGNYDSYELRLRFVRCAYCHKRQVVCVWVEAVRQKGFAGVMRIVERLCLHCGESNG